MFVVFFFLSDDINASYFKCLHLDHIIRDQIKAIEGRIQSKMILT